MDLKQLKTFYTVVTLGGFTRAAAALYYAQSTVSEQMKMLERELNAELFRKNGRKMMLTEAGELVVQYARSMLDLEDEMRGEVLGKDQIRGTLTIKVPETVSIQIMPEILEKFQGNFPAVGLQFRNCSYYDLERELLSGIIHLAFLITDTYEADGLEAETLCDMPLSMICAPNHPLLSLKSVSLDDIKDYPFILTDNDCSYGLNIERCMIEKKVKMRRLLRYNNTMALKRSVMAGNSISIIPKISVGTEIANNLISELPWSENFGTDIKLLMISRKNKWKPPMLPAFMDLFRQRIQGLSK